MHTKVSAVSSEEHPKADELRVGSDLVEDPYFDFECSKQPLERDFVRVEIDSEVYLSSNDSFTKPIRPRMSEPVSLDSEVSIVESVGSAYSDISLGLCHDSIAARSGVDGRGEVDKVFENISWVTR